MTTLIERLSLSAGETLIPLGENDKVSLGSGYDTLTDMLHDGIVATSSSQPPDDNSTGLRTHSFIDIVEDTSEFLETLSISLKAAARGFGGRASASYSMFRSLSFNTKDVFALFYVKVIDKVQTVYDPGLSKRANEEWNNQPASKRKSALIRVYGDSYISRVVTGGELLAMFRINAATRKEREQIKASARAAFGAFRASGDYSKLTTFFSQHTHTVMEVSKAGGAGETPKPELQALIDYAVAFPTQVDSSAGGRSVQILAVAKPVEHLQNGNNNIDLSSAQADALMESLGAYQVALRQRREEAEFISSSPKLFPQVDQKDITANLKIIDDNKSKADATYSRIIDDRFSDLSSIEVPNIRDLPELPGVASGTPVPVKIYLNNQHIFGTKWDIEAEGGEWVSFEALFGMRLECDALSANTYLEYRLIDELGTEIPMSKQGTTAVVATNAQTAVGLVIQVVGEHASGYSVHYAIRPKAGGSYFAQDGEKLSMWRNAHGWVVNGLRIDLFLA